MQQFAANAAYVVAFGTCSAYGGVPAARGNPTGAVSLGTRVGVTKVVNIPGCPAHPDWLVGAIAYILKNNAPPALDSLRRPRTFYPKIIHEECPYEDDDEHDHRHDQSRSRSGTAVRPQTSPANQPTRRFPNSRGYRRSPNEN